jgi:hypothetical protein
MLLPITRPCSSVPTELDSRVAHAVRQMAMARVTGGKVNQSASSEAGTTTRVMRGAMGSADQMVSVRGEKRRDRAPISPKFTTKNGMEIYATNSAMRTTPACHSSTRYMGNARKNPYIAR